MGRCSSEARGLKVLYRQVEGEGHLFDIFFLGGLLYRLILKEVRGDFCRLRDISFLVEIDKAVRECHLNTSSKLPSYTG